MCGKYLRKWVLSMVGVVFGGIVVAGGNGLYDATGGSVRISLASSFVLLVLGVSLLLNLYYAGRLSAQSTSDIGLGIVVFFTLYLPTVVRDIGVTIDAVGSELSLGMFLPAVLIVPLLVFGYRQSGNHREKRGILLLGTAVLLTIPLELVGGVAETALVVLALVLGGTGFFYAETYR